MPNVTMPGASAAGAVHLSRSKATATLPKRHQDRCVGIGSERRTSTSVPPSTDPTSGWIESTEGRCATVNKWAVAMKSTLLKETLNDKLSPVSAEASSGGLLHFSDVLLSTVASTAWIPKRQTTDAPLLMKPLPRT
eukprot:scaffold1484_cov241-Pinguiococcus_pyrenoidosus.AAC.17